MDDKNQKVDVPMEQKLKNLYDLQQIQTEINKIKSLRGELPLEVQDLEDELAGLQTRIANLKAEVKEDEQGISNEKHKIAQCQEDIKKYQSQQDNVRNNREYDSLSKEIEFQTLEIELSEKHIREFTADLEHKKEVIEAAETKYNERKGDLKQKRSELDSIISETQKKEDELNVKKAEIESLIEDRYLTAFNRISGNVRNGLAVVTVQRDACGGCFNKIPPQRQVDIRSRERIIVCEYCGRILVDSGLAEL